MDDLEHEHTQQDRPDDAFSSEVQPAAGDWESGEAAGLNQDSLLPGYAPAGSTEVRDCEEPADVLAATNPMALIEQHLREVHDATEQATRRLVELEDELDRRDYERLLHERQCDIAAAEIGHYRDELADAQDRIAGLNERSERADSLSITLEYERHLHDMQCALAESRIHEVEQEAAHQVEAAQAAVQDAQDAQAEAQAQAQAHAEAEAEPQIDPELIARVQQLEEELGKRDYERGVYERQCDEARETIDHLKGELDAAREAAEAAATASSSCDHPEDSDAQHGEIPEDHMVVAKSDIDQRDKAIGLLKDHIQSLRGELQKSRDQFTGQQKKMQELQQQLDRVSEHAGGQDPEHGHGHGHGHEQDQDHPRRKQVTSAEVGSQLATVRAERQAVLEAKRMLEEAEQRLIRKWAPGRAASRLFWAVMTLGILAAGSYFGVMLFVPALYEATATVTVSPKPGSEMSGDDKLAWQTVHERLALDGMIVKATADRLRQRGVDAVSSPEELTPILEESLVVSSPEPGTMQLSLSAKGNGYAQRLLDTYTQAFVSQSKAAQHVRTDGGITKVLVPAMTNPIPLDERQRLLMAMGIFAGSLVCCTLIGVVVTRRLRRSTGMLSRLDDDDLFDLSPTATDWDTSRLSETNVIT
ncbi:MAG: hypothetical protein D8M59_17005 [Planctomycetes bacterium]|nr:hypothetical protein [Planctomycetota bacterium]